MPKNKTVIKDDDLELEEKPLVPESVEENSTDGTEEEEDDGLLDEDEVDPFHDKWEE